jgi:hypothetical protein
VTERLEDLLTIAVRERAVACSELTDAKGTIATLSAELRDAQLDLAVARELLAYHDLTPVEEAT